MAIQEVCTVTENTCLAEGLYHMVLNAPSLAPLAQPGQFVHVLCGEGNFLRRPISICTAGNGCLQMVFQVKGEGTAWLAKRQAGQSLDVLGTLGHGYEMSCLGDRPYFVGGGIGVPPLLYAMQQAKAAGASCTAILGFRHADMVILEQAFQAVGDVSVCTDDGSYGRQGFVTEVLQEQLAQATSICACGPKVMLRAVAALGKQADIPCQVSMEERMGCGIGACLVCACALQAENGEQRYGHVCKDGPVFRAEEVVW